MVSLHRGSGRIYRGLVITMRCLHESVGSIILLTVGYTDLVQVQEICGSMTTADLGGFGQMQTIAPFSTLILTWVGFGSTKLVLIGFIILVPTFGRLIASNVSVHAMP